MTTVTKARFTNRGQRTSVRSMSSSQVSGKIRIYETRTFLNQVVLPNRYTTHTHGGVSIMSIKSTDRDDDHAMREYVSELWAEDWDSPEDSVYDTW